MSLDINIRGKGITLKIIIIAGNLRFFLPEDLENRKVLTLPEGKGVS